MACRVVPATLNVQYYPTTFGANCSEMPPKFFTQPLSSLRNPTQCIGRSGVATASRLRGVSFVAAAVRPPVVALWSRRRSSNGGAIGAKFSSAERRPPDINQHVGNKCFTPLLSWIVKTRRPDVLSGFSGTATAVGAADTARVRNGNSPEW